MDQPRRESRVETVIQTLAEGLGSGIGWLASTGILFGIFALLWVGFGAALLLSQGSIDAAWQWVNDLPLILKLLAWLLFLPVMAGMWVWETTWPVVLRLLLVAGVAGWNLLVLLPRAAAR
jgi:hypothetical protein